MKEKTANMFPSSSSSSSASTVVNSERENFEREIS
jgi:hypothetical protein